MGMDVHSSCFCRSVSRWPCSALSLILSLGPWLQCWTHDTSPEKIYRSSVQPTPPTPILTLVAAQGEGAERPPGVSSARSLSLTSGRKPGFKGVNVRCFESSTCCNSCCFVAETISFFLIAGIWVSGLDVRIYANKMQLSFREENGKMFYPGNKGQEEQALPISPSPGSQGRGLLPDRGGFSLSSEALLYPFPWQSMKKAGEWYTRANTHVWPHRHTPSVGS